MNDPTIKLNALLSDFDAGYRLSQEDREWLNMKAVGRENIFDDFSVNQLERLASYRLKEAIKKTNNVNQKLNKTIKNLKK